MISGKKKRLGLTFTSNFTSLGLGHFFNITHFTISSAAHVSVVPCNVPSAFAEFESFFEEFNLSQF